MTNKMIMTYDVISVNRREIKLTGTSKLIFKILNPTKKMLKNAKNKDEVVAVVVDTFEPIRNDIIVINAIDVLTLNQMMKEY